ncbi:MAG: dihydrofolate reductase family protein [Actinomycetota bacterium]|nr:dihydrofolate reductase family protein [Actinomycetota bacterium]
MERWTPSGAVDDDELVRLYHHAPGRVRANFVSTVDGAATGDDGRSGTINNEADLRVFETLRALADVVLVGAGTARTEGYAEITVPERLASTRAELGLPAGLELAVVTRSGILSERLLGASAPPLVITHEGCHHLEPLRERLGSDRVLVHGTTEVDLGAALVGLAARGLVRVLTEGGPHLFASLLGAGLVDELCLTTTPQLVGGHPPRIVAAHEWFAPPRGAHLEHVLVEGSTVLARWSLSC